MAGGQAIALDIGTSGIRGQLLSIETGKVMRTHILSGNPIPGSNVMDHLTFAMEYGTSEARKLILQAVGDIIKHLRPDDLKIISVCGNPIQLSVFEGIEIRDLAYAGENKLISENISRADRKGHVISGDAIGLPQRVEVMIPPALRHEIGADALAMMVMSGFLDDDMCMATDYGTNAEMALKVGDDIYTGSAAAGPALEGQQISAGMLAGPGALCDMEKTPEGWLTKVLNERMNALDGPILGIRNNIVRKNGIVPSGITGTGVIALVYAGMKDERIDPPKIQGGSIDLGRGMSFSENDMKEAGKAIGAIRAGHMTLIKEAGIGPEEISTMYMAGAAGTYMDPLKAKSIGMIPPRTKRIVQAGNTSLELARKLALHPDTMDDLNEMRKELLSKHVMFASSKVFSDLYVMEIAYWTEGMPLDTYRSRLPQFGLEGYLDSDPCAETERRTRSITETGEFGMSEPSAALESAWDCGRCMKCVRSCPEKALSFSGGTFKIRTSRCLGSACRKCEGSCKDGTFKHSSFEPK